MAGKLMNCKTCGKEIAKSAKRCPHCSAKNKPPMSVRLLAAVLAIVIIGVIGSMANQGDAEPKAATTAPVDSSSATTKPTTTQQAVVTSFGVGEPAEMDGIVVEMTVIAESEGTSFYEPDDGNIFLLCSFEIINNSSSELGISSLISFATYVDDYATSMSLSATLCSGDNQLDGAVAAGKKMKGTIGYEVPADWSTVEVRFSPSVWSGKQFTFVASK